VSSDSPQRASLVELTLHPSPPGSPRSELDLGDMTELGAPMSDPISDKLNGSLLIVEAESAAAVRAVIEKDIYWTSDVVSSSVVYPPALLSPFDYVPHLLIFFRVGGLWGARLDAAVYSGIKRSSKSGRPLSPSTYFKMGCRSGTPKSSRTECRRKYLVLAVRIC
jgi:hypothetical protein